MIILVDKPLGWTMLDLVNYYKNEYPNKKISFAGRLDPIATGKVKLLLDDSIKLNIEESSGFKKYSFNLIHGIQTDSYDILGFPKVVGKSNLITTGVYLQEYPPYSSVLIKEHKLPYWQCTKRNLIVTDKPTKEIEIKDITVKNTFIIEKDKLIDTIERIFDTLSKDTFRQKEILESWKKLDFTNVEISECEAVISSGCYIRWIANQSNCCAFGINRLEYH